MRYFILWICYFIYIAQSDNIMAIQPQYRISFDKLALKYQGNQQWDSCLFYHYVLAHQFRQSNNQTGLAREWAAISLADLQKNQYERAEASRKIAMRYFTPIENAAFTNLYWGLLFLKKENWKKSISFLSKVPANNRKEYRSDDIKELALGENYYKLKQITRSDAVLTPLLNRMTQKGDSFWYGYAQGYYISGMNNLYKLNYNSAIQCFSKAIHCYESTGLLNNYWLNCYQTILETLWSRGQMKKSNPYFLQLTGQIEKHKLQTKFQFEYYSLKGLFYQSTLNKSEAIDAFSKAMETPGITPKNKALLIPKLIELYFCAGQFNKAILLANPIPEECLDDYSKIIVAHCYEKLGDFPSCQKWLHKTGTSSFLHDNRLLSQLSQIYFECKDYDRAEYFYKLSLKYDIKNFGKSHYTTSISYSSLGYFYWMARADYQRSLDNYHKEIQALTNETKLNDYFQLPDISHSINDEYLAKALNNKAEALCEIAKSKPIKEVAIKYLKAGLANFELSVEVAHRYKMSLARDEKRLLFADLVKHRFPNIIKTSLSLYQKTGEDTYLEKAFDYTEKSKSSLLLSAVRSVNSYKLHQIPDALKHTEETIDYQTAMISRQVSEEYKQPHPDLTQIDRFNNLLYLLKQQQNNLIQTLKKRYPAYYNARYNSNTTTARDLQKILAPNEAILQYSVSKSFLALFLITKKQFTCFSQPLDNHFYSEVDKFHKRISEFSFTDLNDSSVLAFAKLSNHLYGHLIKPAESMITGKKLIIIPDDVLNQIPFEALVSRLPAQNQKCRYKDMCYFLKEHPISYSYSGTLLALNHQSRNYQNSRLLAVAPEYTRFKFSNLLQNDKEAMRGDSSEIAPIPGTLTEAKSIGEIFNGNTLLKEKASKTGFEKIAGNFDIIHLAMHGIINNEYPMFSKLVFSVNQNVPGNEFLNTYEIYNLKLNSPLIVLSACNTGAGKLHTGEGIMSLARGFFTAGVKSLVMTLWSVADKTSSKLMGNFYNNLAHKNSISDALCKAKLDYINEGDEISAHPYFWAGYIVMGNSSSTFEPQKSHSDYYYGGGALIVLLSGMLIWRRKKSPKI